ncbi:MAG: hypothetical protein EZS28_027114 [Streblomastix strix]|uniref:Uncharacterized protein n=1 Tax=Streblomastix strix TaxID=222440 RepID=A0A5J4V3M3_9EUKA|nr:MAG: hypothetical protein EZS28_027114 [Streblomastix strix]
MSFYSNETKKTNFVFAHLVGQVARIRLIDGLLYIGIYSGSKSDGDDSIIRLSQCTQYTKAFSQPHPFIQIKESNIAEIYFPSCSLIPPNSKKKAFTDVEITDNKGQAVFEGEFKNFFSDDIIPSDSFQTLEGQSSKHDLEWDQYKVNMDK